MFTYTQKNMKKTDNKNDIRDVCSTNGNDDSDDDHDDDVDVKDLATKNDSDD